MNQTTEPQIQPQPQAQVKQFSLATVIFTPFTALSSDPQPTAPEEKISRILQNLNTQHEAVRRNMLGMLQERSRVLVLNAEAGLASLEDDSEDDDGHAREARAEEVRGSRVEMLRNVRVKMREGSKVEDYEVKPGISFSDSLPTDTDVEMSDASQPLTKHAIQAALSNELRELVEGGVLILGEYDKHAAKSTEVYNQTLEQRKERTGSVPGAPTLVGSAATYEPLGGRGGILRNGHEQSPVDLVAMRRLSTGMPVATSSAATRTMETFEEVARRGSASK